MRLCVLLLPTILAACALPSRQSFAPNPVGADTQTIAASAAFAGRIPLVTILPGTTDFAAPVAGAVRQALAIKPGAMFDVEAQIPKAVLSGFTSNLVIVNTAAAVAKSIVADGVAAANVSLTAKSAGLDAVINVYVK